MFGYYIVFCVIFNAFCDNVMFDEVKWRLGGATAHRKIS